MSTNLASLLCTLLTANHILDYFSLVTGYGHISVRNPLTNNTFVFSPNTAPSNILDASSFVEFHISNGSALNGYTSSPLSELWIHQAILQRYPSVNSVVHSHSRAVLPFANSNIALRPLFNLEAFLGGMDGEGVPVFDIADFYSPNSTHNILVNTARLGANLANTFSTPAHNVSKTNTSPDFPVVLQTSHGFVAVGGRIEEATWRAWGTQDAAEILREGLSVAGNGGGEIRYMDEVEMRDSRSLADGGGWQRDWDVWVTKVRASAAYRDELC